MEISAMLIIVPLSPTAKVLFTQHATRISLKHFLIYLEQNWKTFVSKWTHSFYWFSFATYFYNIKKQNKANKQTKKN